MVKYRAISVDNTDPSLSTYDLDEAKKSGERRGREAAAHNLMYNTHFPVQYKIQVIVDGGPWKDVIEDDA